MKRLSISLNNLVEGYYNAKREMNEVWNAYIMMRGLGFIDDALWYRFYEKCKDWDYNADLGIVVDSQGRQVIL